MHNSTSKMFDALGVSVTASKTDSGPKNVSEDTPQITAPTLSMSNTMKNALTNVLGLSAGKTVTPMD